jgi:uncharacterized protein YqeY
MDIIQIKAMRMTAKRERNKVTASILTLVLGEYETKEKRGETPDIVKIAKKLIDSNTEIMAARPDDKLVAENAVLLQLLPKQMTEDQLRAAIHASQAPNIGMVMKYLGTHHANTYDKGLASKLAKDILATTILM